MIKNFEEERQIILIATVIYAVICFVIVFNTKSDFILFFILLTMFLIIITDFILFTFYVKPKSVNIVLENIKVQGTQKSLIETFIIIFTDKLRRMSLDATDFIQYSRYTNRIVLKNQSHRILHLEPLKNKQISVKLLNKKHASPKVEKEYPTNPIHFENENQIQKFFEIIIPGYFH
jgi:hypothetical protein